jgi:hypothetical protein
VPLPEIGALYLRDFRFKTTIDIIVYQMKKKVRWAGSGIKQRLRK